MGKISFRVLLQTADKWALLCACSHTKSVLFCILDTLFRVTKPQPYFDPTKLCDNLDISECAS